MDRFNFNTKKRPGKKGNSYKSNTHDSFENICGREMHNGGRLNEMALGRNNPGGTTATEQTSANLKRKQGFPQEPEHINTSQLPQHTAQG